MAPDEPWAQRKYAQGLPPGKVDGYRTQDIVSAHDDATMKDYLDGRDHVPVEAGQQEAYKK
jgi:hypothetical protein